MATPGKSADGGGGSFRRRDHLASIEAEVQKLWDEHRAYEVQAPSDGDEVADGKYFCTFPYPYMNGRLHLGHAFTITKSEFQARYQRLQGKNVLWPFGFHCTGMPIAACADKLARELEGASTTVPSEPQSPTEGDEPKGADAAQLGKFTTKKSKAVAKSGPAKTQREILASCGVPDQEIPKFADPHYWLSYFPPLGQSDLKKFGMAVDWRRSFITTNKNPYYDAFVRWQFNILRRRGHVKFGTRPSIFSRIDNQPCADHDRASGEGVGPQEYTLIKIKIKDELPPHVLAKLESTEGKSFYLVAATLRPETMYGQTNCFLLPEGNYGFFIAFDEPAVIVDGSNPTGILQRVMSREAALKCSTTVFVCSLRSATNMGYQGILPVELSSDRFATPFCLGTVTGADLLGLALSAPNAVYETVYSLPMMGISMEKGTGVVTSVPSDAPDDYAAYRDLQEKQALREKYGLTEKMVSMDVVEIIDIPGLGRRAAVDVCIRKKIRSQNDKVLLTEAKEECYKRGFYEGIMLVGSQQGKKVCDAKAIVREEMIGAGTALGYYEPEKKVMSRSGDDCVVALCNQWYLDYADPEWKAAVLSYVTKGHFHCYSQRCLQQFEFVVNWLREWACSRHYGLGTYLPWEEESKVLIESLSDSTIYMAYYTIAHFLQSDLDGSQMGSLGIAAEELTDDVFDYVFEQREDYPMSNIAREKLDVMRQSFSYWYPMDLRVSGKDLIFNHLTMSLYCHVAIWPNKPIRWPQSFFCNGHVLVDAEKMAKSAGNFLTLSQAVEDFTADATRIGLADAGDSLDDANFSRETANSAIMRLYLLDQFVEEMLASTSLRSGDSKIWIDLAFENEIISLAHQAKQAYDRMVYRDALKASLFDFTTLRDVYRNMVGTQGMHRDLIGLWMETQTVLLAPIAPHLCEFLWSKRLGKAGLVVNAAWPAFVGKAFDIVLHREFECLLASLEDLRKVKEKSGAMGRKGKKGVATSGDGPLDSAVIYVAKEYLPWQQLVLRILQEIPLDDSQKAPVDPSFMSIVKEHPEIGKLDKKLTKEVMGFASFRMKEDLAARGPAALELELPFDELALLQRNEEFVKRSLGLQHLDIQWNTIQHEKDNSSKRESAIPSRPAAVFWSSC